MAPPVWCSPLVRCLATAAGVLESVSVPDGERYTDDGLMARQEGGQHCHVRDDRTTITTRWQQFDHRRLCAFDPGLERNERFESVRHRVTTLLHALSQRYAGVDRPVVVVTHCEAIRSVTGASFRNAEYAYVEWP